MMMNDSVTVGITEDNGQDKRGEREKESWEVKVVHVTNVELAKESFHISTHRT